MQTEELIKLILKASQSFKEESLLKSHDERTFNNTEMRLIGFVIYNDELGKKVISTQIARNLGITRSAVSQMVNRLAERGVVQRVPSEFDRKIAYIELSEASRSEYEEQKVKMEETLQKVSEIMGEADMNEFIRLLNKFIESREQVVGKKQ